MSENNHLKFNFAPDQIGQANISVQVENNLVSWLNHAFLEIGGWVNIPTGTTGYYGGVDLSRLYPVDDPNYTDYQVWQGFRKDWVFESGSDIEYNTGNPIVCSGVYVNSTFYPSATTTGAYAHTVQFPAGRIVFINSGAIGSGAISSTSNIKAAFSYRLVQINKGDADWFKQFQYFSMRADNSHFLQMGSGAWDVDWRNRLQLPAVVVQLVPTKTSKPWQLGTLASWNYQRCNFYVMAEDDYWCKQLRDLLGSQHDRTIYMYDVNRVEDSGVYPLNAFGALNPSGLMYPDLVTESGLGGYRYKMIRFTDVTLSDMKTPHPNLHGAVVRTSLEYIT